MLNLNNGYNGYNRYNRFKYVFNVETL